jgi:hypothetical protein
VLKREVPSVRLDEAAGGIAPFHVDAHRSRLLACSFRGDWLREERACRLFFHERTVRRVPTPLLLSMCVVPCDGTTQSRARIVRCR